MSKRFMIYKKTTRKNWVGNGVQVRKREEKMASKVVISDKAP